MFTQFHFLIWGWHLMRTEKLYYFFYWSYLAWTDAYSRLWDFVLTVLTLLYAWGIKCKMWHADNNCKLKGINDWQPNVGEVLLQLQTGKSYHGTDSCFWLHICWGAGAGVLRYKTRHFVTFTLLFLHLLLFLFTIFFFSSPVFELGDPLFPCSPL